MSINISGVKHIIAIASGKGGVGKSTVAMNLAVALSVGGQKVGLLDADIYGPSQARMLGCLGKQPESDGERIDPVINHGIKVMSMGFMGDDDTPMAWRGPMVASALKQMLFQVNWGELDVLVVDLPPGTGDIQLSLAQNVNVSGALIVSTPQDVALMDARKALRMFEKVNVPTLGIIENMSVFVCPDCGHQAHIFAHGGALKMAEEIGVDVLGQIPLDLNTRIWADEGKPVLLQDPDGAQAKEFRTLANKVSEKLKSVKSRSSTKVQIQDVA